MQIRRRQLDVAQGRNLEGAADALDVETLGREIRQPLAPAQTQIEVIGLGVGGDRRVSRRAERVVSEIGEQPVLGIARLGLADMTGEAIALLWILEQREALGLQRRKPRFPTQNRVESRGEGMEDLRSLIGREGLHELAEAGVGVVEHVLAENRAREIGVSALAHLGDNGRLGGIVHFDRIEQRPAGLRREVERPPVAELAAHRLFFDLAGFLVLLVREGERRAERGVGQRGRLAQAERASGRAARHAGNRRTIHAGKRLGGIVARGAGDAARLRQGRVHEKTGAQLLQRRELGARLRAPRGPGQKQREDAGSHRVMSGTTREANIRRHENHQRLYPTMAGQADRTYRKAGASASNSMIWRISREAAGGPAKPTRAKDAVRERRKNLAIRTKHAQ